MYCRRPAAAAAAAARRGVIRVNGHQSTGARRYMTTVTPFTAAATAPYSYHTDTHQSQCPCTVASSVGVAAYGNVTYAYRRLRVRRRHQTARVVALRSSLECHAELCKYAYLQSMQANKVISV